MVTWVLVFYASFAWKGMSITAIVPMKDEAACTQFRDQILIAVGASADADSKLLVCHDISKGHGSIDPSPQP